MASLHVGARDKRELRRLRDGSGHAMSASFDTKTGGLSDMEALGGDEAEDAEIDSVWNTTYKLNYNQTNSAARGNPALQLPIIKGRTRHGTRGAPNTLAMTFPPPMLPNKVDFYTLKQKLSTPHGVNIGGLAGKLYPDRKSLTVSLVQTSRYDFQLMSPPRKAPTAEELAVTPAANNASTIRFLGLTLPGMEVPIMSRLNSKFKMPEF
jgi:hypothetical protein